MKSTLLLLACLAFASSVNLLAGLSVHASDAALDKGAVLSSWIAVGDDGKLRYKTTHDGDRILDFSYAGYGGGGVKLPAVAVRKEVAPAGGDDSAAVQAAIDAVGVLPLTDGFRGAVLLGPGTFRCSAPLTISHDGVVLRGSGAGRDETVIEMTGSPHVCIAIAGERVRLPKENAAASIAISDAYVPSGALSFSVSNAGGLSAGDAILIHWPRTEKWIHFMGMDNLVRDGKHQTWIKTDSPVTYERTIRAVEGNRIALDVPLTEAIDAKFLPPGAAAVMKTTPPKRLGQCGIESLRINSPPPSGTLSAKNNLGIKLENCQDCWIKDIGMHDPLGNVEVVGARRITIADVHAVHTATVDKGAGYPADFLIRGSQVLIDRCSSKGDGSFYVGTLSSDAYLNVALNCTFAGKGAIQPHMRWSTGLLVDSCHLADGRIEFINRRTAGSGHGWAIGWAVAWDCTAKALDMQQPPGAMNWCIGGAGAMEKGSSPECFSSQGTPAAPRSLYLAQLRERLGDGAVRNIGY